MLLIRKEKAVKSRLVYTLMSVWSEKRMVKWEEAAAWE